LPEILKLLPKIRLLSKKRIERYFIIGSFL
jgi:hypothetical protein